MSEVLTPRLELFRGFANIVGQLHKGIPEAMRFKIGQAGAHKGFPGNGTNGRGVGRVVP